MTLLPRTPDQSSSFWLTVFQAQSSKGEWKSWLRIFRYAMRLVSKTPAFARAVVVVIALTWRCCGPTSVAPTATTEASGVPDRPEPSVHVTAPGRIYKPTAPSEPDVHSQLNSRR